MAGRILTILEVVFLFFSCGNAAVSFDGCGKTKECLFSPPNCTQQNPPNCDRFLSWYYKDGEDVVHFEMAAKAERTPNDFYAAVGFGYTNAMGNSSVTFCTTSSSGKLKPLLGFNPHGHQGTDLIGGFDNDIVTNFGGALVNDMLQCTFSQKIKVPVSVSSSSNGRIFSLDASNYYLILASGPYNETAGEVSFHYHTPLMTDTAVYLLSPPGAIRLISKNGCGYAKGCLATPPECEPGVDCDRVVTYSVLKEENSVLFELSARRPTNLTDFYAAIGFSGPGVMANASVTACTLAGSTIGISMWHNPAPGHKAPQRVNFANGETTMVKLKEAGVVNDILTCRFTQMIHIPSEDKAQSDLLVPLDAKYHLLLARGNYNASTQLLKMHTEVPLISNEQIDVTGPFNPVTTPISKTECGKSKGCLDTPDSCVGPDDACRLLTYTVTADGQWVEFEISARTIKTPQHYTELSLYAAVGLSNDTKMADTAFTFCSYSHSNGPDVNFGYIPPQKPDDFMLPTILNVTKDVKDKYLKVISAGVVDDTFVCRFQQKIDPPKDWPDQIVSLKEYRYIFVLRGPFEDGYTDAHTEIPIITSSKMNLTDYKNSQMTTPSPSGVCNGKGCIRSSDSCTPGVDCDKSLTYIIDPATPNYVSFELTSKAPADSGVVYIAAGFSLDQYMGDDTVTACSYDPSTGKGSIGLFFNPGPKSSHKASEKVDLGTAKDVVILDSVTKTNNIISCKFKQLINPPDTLKSKIYPLGANLFNMFLARGPYDAKNNILLFHSEQPFISQSVNATTTLSVIGITTTTKSTGEGQPAPTATPSPSGGCDGKGCIRSSGSCTPGVDCDKSLTYVIDPATPTYVSFELALKTPPGVSGVVYVAAGFSLDQYMGDDTVTACSYDPASAKGTIGLFFNPGPRSSHKDTEKVDLGTAKDVVILDSVSMKNNLIICKFKQLINPPDSLKSKIYPLNSNLYQMFLARGPYDAKDNIPEEHSEIPFISGAVNVTTTQSTGAGAKGDNIYIKMKKAHGILMILGWWVFIVNGILIARYFKSVINHDFGGVKLWFHLHRIVNSVGLLFISIAFILIFVARSGIWAGNDFEAAGTHSILGLTAVVSGLFNPIMALARCHPGTPNRPIFNWAHRTVGILAWVCASAAIFEITKKPFLYDLTVDGPYKAVPRSLMYAYFIVLGVVVLVLEELYASYEGKNAGVSSLFTKQPSPEPIANGTVESPAPKKTKFGFFRLVALVGFNLVAISIAIAEICFVALADVSAPA